MIPKFITYKTLPPELLVIKDKAFAHSVFTPEAQAMDDLGEYTALYFDDKFIGAMNTIYNQKPLELWSNNEIKIDEPYAFFCRGFIGDGVRLGLGAPILLLLLSIITAISGERIRQNFYTTSREKNKSIINQLLNCGYVKQEQFTSNHQDENTELTLFKYQLKVEFTDEKKAELISYIQQKLS